MHLIEPFLLFWRQHPALFYGVSFLLGFYTAFYSITYTLVPIIIFWIPLFIFNIKNSIYIKFFILNILLFLSSWIYGTTCYTFPRVPPEGIKGIAHITIESFSSQTTYFGKQWLYKITIHRFQADQDSTPIAKNIRCSLSLPQNSAIRRPPGHHSYLIQGVLHQSPNGSYFYKANKQLDWQIIDSSWNLVEWRYRTKQELKDWIHQLIFHAKSATFLAGLATGEFDDTYLQSDFARFGLQHIMAISGFHFAVIASILSFLLRLFVSRHIGTVCIISLLAIYMLLLGNSASVIRAWVMISITLIGDYIGRQGNSLNSLGIALLIVLLLDPLLCLTVGFQLSFLATLAILLFHPPCHYFFTHILLKRPLSQMIKMDRLNQHGYCLLAFFRQGIALAIAINSLVIPVTLYYFHQFSVMSLFYNLFFPFLVSFSLFFLLIGVIFSIVFSPIGNIIHYINSCYTRWILKFTSTLPQSVDQYYEVESLSAEFVIYYLCFVIAFGIFLKIYMARKRLESQSWSYL